MALIGAGGAAGRARGGGAKVLAGIGVEVLSVELGKESSHPMRAVAKESGGKYLLAKTAEEVKRFIL